jgi:hypothetical protein
LKSLLLASGAGSAFYRGPQEESKYTSSPNSLITGQPAEAAKGIFGFLGVEEYDVRDNMRRGIAAIEEEIQRHGTDEDRENLHYVLHGEAGNSKASFQNGWMRDRTPDGALMTERQAGDGRGMRFLDFVQSAPAQAASLQDAHVLALRL